MKRKLRSSANLRIDRLDWDDIHNQTDEDLRVRGSVMVAETPPGLDIATVAFDPEGVVVEGWTVRVNPVDNQQVLVTPGIAYCYEKLPDGTISFGQLTVEDVTEVPVVMAAPNAVKGLWARFLYLDGVTQNRARWRPDLTPETEEIFAHDTREVGSVSVAITANPALPPDANGWFKIAELDYTAGFLIAADISDRRTLLFEGQAAGSVNPATTWTIPDFDRTNDRSVIGAKSVFGFAMRALKKIGELAGRDWYLSPGYGENVRSASGAFVVGSDATLANGLHERITATTFSGLRRAMGSLEVGDSRSHIFHAGDSFGSPSAYDMDMAALGGSVTIGNIRESLVEGHGKFKRTNGNNVMFQTTGPSQYTAVIRGLSFEGAAGTGALFELTQTTDRVRFENCTFEASFANVTVLVKLSAAGAQADFVSCDFIALNGGNADHVEMAAGTRVTLKGCRFSGGRYGVSELGAVDWMVMDGCYFGSPDLLSSAVNGVVGNGNWIGNNNEAGAAGFTLNAISFGPEVFADLVDLVFIGQQEFSAFTVRATGGTLYTDPSPEISKKIQHASAGDELLARNRTAQLSHVLARSVRLDNSADDLKLRRSMTGSITATTLMVTDQAGDANDPGAAVLHAFRHRFGPLHVPATGTKLLEMDQSLVPVSWGVLRKAEGAANANLTYISGSMLGYDNAIVPFESRLGAQKWHAYAIPVLPSTQIGSGFAKVGGIPAYSVEVTVMTGDTISVAGANDLGVDSNGIVHRTSHAIWDMNEIGFKVQPQFVVGASGVAVGPYGDTHSGSVVGVPDAYMIAWQIFAKHSVWAP